jgi:hypothetical protein
MLMDTNLELLNVFTRRKFNIQAGLGVFDRDQSQKSQINLNFGRDPRQ